MSSRHLELRFKIPFEIYLEGGYYISSCPPLDVFSQGVTEQEAFDNLGEALGLFLEGCYEMGTLVTVLKECGFGVITSETTSYEGMSFIDIPIHLTATEMSNR